MASIFQKNKLFFLLSVAFAVFCALQVLFFQKGGLVLWFADNRNFIADTFFKYITYIGDGWAFVIASLVLGFFVKLRWGIISLFTYTVSGLLAQFFKKIVFGPLPRPLKYFEGNEDLVPIEGIHNAYVHSFPSGHTTTAFALLSLIALLYSGNKGVAFLCANLAILTAVSRIYLAQHFTEDVLAGIFLGSTCSILFYYWFEEKQIGFFAKPSLNRPLFKLKK